MGDFITRYFRRASKYSKPVFIIEITMATLLIKVIFGIIWNISGGHAGGLSTTELVRVNFANPLYLIIITCFAAPFLETLIGQWLPIWVASWATKNSGILIAVSTVAFSLLHYRPGMIGHIVAMGPGILFAWSFIVWRERSMWEGYWVTSVIHSLHNILSLYFYFLKN